MQWLSTRLVADLWRWSAGVDVRAQLAGLKRFGLWESPVGLLYFDPPIAGDDAFYQAFYQRYRLHDRLSRTPGPRGEFALAATFLAPGMRVLDVGCGGAGFRDYVPEAAYTGLDTHFGGTDRDILAESIEEHAAREGQAYDAVCAFQVIEHVPDPVAFAETMLRALRPGGTLMLGVPCWPSTMTDIPNFIVNAPPHHLTIWNEQALRALAERLGLKVRAVAPVAMTRESSIAHWMGRIGAKNSDRLFAADWRWHAKLAWAWIAGSVVDRLRDPPADAPPISLLLVAEKA